MIIQVDVVFPVTFIVTHEKCGWQWLIQKIEKLFFWGFAVVFRTRFRPVLPPLHKNRAGTKPAPHTDSASALPATVLGIAQDRQNPNEQIGNIHVNIQR